MTTQAQTLQRLYNAITDNRINKTWIETLEPDGGEPWKELTEALGAAEKQLAASQSGMRAVDDPCRFPDGGPYVPPMFPPPASDDVRSALAEEIEMGNGLILMTVLGTTKQLGIKKTSQIVAALRSTPISKP